MSTQVMAVFFVPKELEIELELAVGVLCLPKNRVIFIDFTDVCESNETYEEKMNDTCCIVYKVAPKYLGLICKWHD